MDKDKNDLSSGQKIVALLICGGFIVVIVILKGIIPGITDTTATIAIGTIGSTAGVLLAQYIADIRKGK